MDYYRKSLEQRREEWMRELLYRQRNIVFPETAMNSARYWANLTCRKYPFTTFQKLGFAFLFVLFGTVGLIAAGTALKGVTGHRMEAEMLIANVPDLAMFMLICVLLVRAAIAVFGRQTFPDLPMSANRKMLMSTRITKRR